MNEEINKKLQELLSLCEKATPGPWEKHLHQPDPFLPKEYWSASVLGPPNEHASWPSTICQCHNSPSVGHHQQDAEFIAEARTALPAVTRALLEAIETLDACGFDGDPSKRLEMVNESLNKIAAILDGVK